MYSNLLCASLCGLTARSSFVELFEASIVARRGLCCDDSNSVDASGHYTARSVDIRDIDAEPNIF